MNSCHNCKECTKVKHRTLEEKKKLIKRLNIIEGQVNGIKKMLEEDRYCEDILIQVSAINKSLKSLGKEVLKGHLNTCIKKSLKEDDDTAIDNVIMLFERLSK